MSRDRLSVPESATEEEAAAIVAAIETYRAGPGDETDADANGHTWRGRQWRFQSRIESLTGERTRVPERAPTSAWRAADRVDRF